MKITSVFLVPFVIGLLTASDKHRLETPNYILVSKSGRFEIRDYESMIVASTTVTAPYREATYTGFRSVANFIFGGNSENLSIAMTAPVMTTVAEDKDLQSFEIAFVMPKKFSIQSLPEPSSEYVKIKPKTLGLTATINFGGWATEGRVRYQIDKLNDYINSKGYTIVGPLIIAQYNSPWALPPFRHNEIIIGIKERKLK